MRLFTVLASIPFVGSNFLGSNADCVDPCISKMQSNDRLGQLSFSQLSGTVDNQQLTERSFESICRALAVERRKLETFSAYEEADACLAQCEPESENAARIRQTYAGIRFICVEHREEFFDSLPCLAKFEPLAMRQCRDQINGSLVASNHFSMTVMNREQHNLRTRFEQLCRSLGEMVSCVEPITRRGCGNGAAQMMLKFITVGFGRQVFYMNFEQIYSQLGISDQLPLACRSLLTTTRPDNVVVHDKLPLSSTSINLPLMPASLIILGLPAILH